MKFLLRMIILAAYLASPLQAQETPELRAWMDAVAAKTSGNMRARDETEDGKPIWGVQEVIVSVVINAEGAVQSARIRESSGYATLDQNARRAVLISSPYPPFPGEVGEAGKTIVMPVRVVFPDRPAS